MQRIADTLNSIIRIGSGRTLGASSSTGPKPGTSSSSTSSKRRAPKRGILYYRRYPVLRLQRYRKQVHFQEASQALKRRRKSSTTSQKWRAYVAEQFRTLQKQRRLRQRQLERAMARDRAVQRARRTTKRKRSSSDGDLTQKEEEKLVNSFIECGKQASGGSIDVTFVPRTSDSEALKRPPNAFIVFAQHARKEFHDEVKPYHSSSVNVVLGQAWRCMSKLDRQAFQDEADRLRTQYFELKQQREAQKTKRPMNAFLLFCQDQRASLSPRVRRYCPQAVVSFLGRKWTRLARAKKQQYFARARQLQCGESNNKPGLAGADVQENESKLQAPETLSTAKESELASEEPAVEAQAAISPEAEEARKVSTAGLKTVVETTTLRPFRVVEKEKHHPSESGDEGTFCCSVGPAGEKWETEVPEIPAKKPRYGSNCNNTQQVTDTDTEGDRSQFSVTFNVPTSSSSSSSGPPLVESVTTTTRKNNGILSTVKRDTTTVVTTDSTPSDSSLASHAHTCRRTRKKKRRRRNIVKKQVTWREMSDEPLTEQDELVTQVLVDGLVEEQDPLCVRQVTESCSYKPSGALSRAQHLHEIHKVFADAEAYFTADSGSFDSLTLECACECMMDSSSSTDDDDDDDDGDDGIMSFLCESEEVFPRKTKYVVREEYNTSSNRGNNINQHSRAGDTSDTDSSSKNQHLLSAAGSSITSLSNDLSADFSASDASWEPSEKRCRHLRFPFKRPKLPGPLAYMSRLQKKGHKLSGKECRSASHRLGTGRHHSGYTIDDMKSIHLDTGGRGIGVSTAGESAEVRKADVTHKHGVTEKDYAQPKYLGPAEENKAFQASGNQRTRDSLRGFGTNRHIDNSKIGTDDNNDDDELDLEAPCDLPNPGPVLAGGTKTSQLGDLGRKKGGAKHQQPPRPKRDLHEAPPAGCHRSQDQDRMWCGEDLLVGDYGGLDLDSAALSDSSLDLFLLESLGEHAPVSASMYTLWNDAAFCRDLPAATIELPEMRASPSEASLSSVGGLRSCWDATYHPSLPFDDFGDCKRRYAKTKKHTSSQIVKHEPPHFPAGKTNQPSPSAVSKLHSFGHEPLDKAVRVSSLQFFSPALRHKGFRPTASDTEKDELGIAGLTASLDSLILSDADIWYRQMKRLT